MGFPVLKLCKRAASAFLPCAPARREGDPEAADALRGQELADYALKMMDERWFGAPPSWQDSEAAGQQLTVSAPAAETVVLEEELMEEEELARADVGSAAPSATPVASPRQDAPPAAAAEPIATGQSAVGEPALSSSPAARATPKASPAPLVIRGFAPRRRASDAPPPAPRSSPPARRFEFLDSDEEEIYCSEPRVRRREGHLGDMYIIHWSSFGEEQSPEEQRTRAEVAAIARDVIANWELWELAARAQSKALSATRPPAAPAATPGVSPDAVPGTEAAPGDNSLISTSASPPLPLSTHALGTPREAGPQPEPSQPEPSRPAPPPPSTGRCMPSQNPSPSMLSPSAVRRQPPESTPAALRTSAAAPPGKRARFEVLIRPSGSLRRKPVVRGQRTGVAELLHPRLPGLEVARLSSGGGARLSGGGEASNINDGRSSTFRRAGRGIEGAAKGMCTNMRHGLEDVYGHGAPGRSSD